MERYYRLHLSSMTLTCPIELLERLVDMTKIGMDQQIHSGNYGNGCVTLATRESKRKYKMSRIKLSTFNLNPKYRYKPW